MNEPYTPEQTEAIRFFLRECQGAQQPRYRVLRCAEELAKVPIQEVAKIAAMLVHNASSAVATNSPVKKDGDDEKPASGGATSKRVDEAESWVEIKPEQNEQDRSKEVEELIAKLKREGIPPKDFDKWWVMFPEWWRRRKSTMNSCNASRKRTTGDKKGKQGRVRSTTDKRLGPRIPAFKQT
jgi:hypothetical protein